MVDLRKSQDYHHHYQDVPPIPTRPMNKKPPLGGSWQPTVPSWEKRFCTTVGSIPWGRLLEAKKVMYYYENVVQWNDSAGEEAFNNAKRRFWAQINGLPCDISLPDPNIYIDEVDWNTAIDPELLLDLDREPVPPDDCGNTDSPGLHGDALLFLNRPVPCTGWGDIDEDPTRTANKSSAEPGFGNSNKNADSKNNPWDYGNTGADGADEDRTWGNGGEKSWGWNQWENNANGSESWNQWENNANGSESFGSRRNSDSWGSGEGSWRKREGNTQYMSRYKTSRFQHEDYQTNGGWRNGRGRKRTNFAYERPVMDKRPFAPRPINSFNPVGHHGSGEAGKLWRWDKQVS